VLRDLAVMLADGGDCLSDLAVLRDQPELFGRIASTPTAWHPHALPPRGGARATGLRNLPFDLLRRNAVWLELVLCAQI
jgi:hypothetical protein